MRILTFLAIALAALLAGCASTDTSDINAVDRGVFVPSARMSIDISPSSETPSRPHSGHGIEVGITGGEGKDGQNIDAGEDPVRFGNTTFLAPNELKHDFEFRYAEVAYRFRHFFNNGNFGIEALGGLGFAELQLTTASPFQSASEKLSSGGLVGGFGIVWNFRATTSLQSRITLFASGDEEGVSSAIRTDVYIVQALGKNAALRAGLASWGVRSSRDATEDGNSNKSPINVYFSGPALALEVMF